MKHLMLQPVVHVAGDGRTAKARWGARSSWQDSWAKNAFWAKAFTRTSTSSGTHLEDSKLHWYHTFMCHTEAMG